MAIRLQSDCDGRFSFSFIYYRSTKSLAFLPAALPSHRIREEVARRQFVDVAKNLINLSSKSSVLEYPLCFRRRSHALLFPGGYSTLPDPDAAAAMIFTDSPTL